MRVDKALAMKPGAKVWIDYTPTLGHGPRINCVGVVESVFNEIKRNTYGVEYVSVSVRYGGIRSVFPSFCLVQL